MGNKSGAIQLPLKKAMASLYLRSRPILIQSYIMMHWEMLQANDTAVQKGAVLNFRLETTPCQAARHAINKTSVKAIRVTQTESLKLTENLKKRKHAIKNT